MGTEPGGIRREGENPTWFFGRSTFCVYMDCLLEFRARIKHTQCWGREIRSGGSVRIHKTRSRGTGRLQAVFYDRAGDETEALGMGKQSERWRSPVCPPGSLAGLIIAFLFFTEILQDFSGSLSSLLSANGSHFVKLLSPITLHWQLLLRLLRDLFSPETFQSPIPLEMCSFEEI